ncbi:alpha/beta hydrolase [Spirillospora sp. NPDC029432]|uniref:alpha/beta fold hydrolase n=1 Tax=Spirillospora sp. NPDC029432 TaxID=3154599 RepID=UPI0034513974
MTLRLTAPDRLGTTRLPDGRDLAWSEWGPPGAPPVLLSPGAATTRRLGTAALDGPAAPAVRLIVLDRPGLGASTPAPGRTFAGFVQDVRDLCALRGLGRPAMAGNSQGAPFALACAAAGAVSALAVVSGSDEIAAEPAALPAGLRELVELTAADPAAAEETFARFTPRAMWDMVMASSPESDLAVYRAPGFAAAYREALEDAFAQGPAGYARDTVLAMGRWPFDLGGIAVPVDLWYGAQDTAHSPDNGAALAARIPGAERHLVPGIGGAVLWTHTEPILRTLLERARG